MPDHSVDHWCPSPGIALEAVRVWFAGVAFGQTMTDWAIYDLTVTVEERHGRWAFKVMTWLSGGEAHRIDWLIVQGTVHGERVPIAWCMSDPTWMSQLSNDQTLNGETYAARWPALMDHWREVVVDSKRAWLLAACSATLTDVVHVDTTADGPETASFASDCYQVLQDAVQFTDSERLAEAYSEFQYDPPLETHVKLAAPAAPAGNVSVAGLQEVTQVLRDLAYKDYTISINNGAVMFSVNGRTIVGSGA